MFKVIIGLAFILTLHLCSSQELSLAPVDQDYDFNRPYIPPTILPIPPAQKCGNYTYGWIWSCRISPNQYIKIFPIKVWYANCTAAPFCLNAVGTVCPAFAYNNLVKWPQKYKCVERSYYTIEAWRYNCFGKTQLIKCQIPSSCYCSCGLPFFYPDIDVAKEPDY